MNHVNTSTVELVGHFGGDVSVVNAARVSFGKQVTSMSDADRELIRFLMTNRHGSPFEHNLFTFRVSCPIFVSREWFRHRIGSFNEFSTRYTEMPDQAFVPAGDAWRTQVGKPGHYVMQPLHDGDREAADAEYGDAVDNAFAAYQRLLDLGVAREVARNVLPLAAMTEFVWTVNARSLMNFLSLRNAAQALREIRDCAAAVEADFVALMPVTAAAFIANNRVAP